jgi:uncharacterized protein (TIGR02757 family)
MVLLTMSPGNCIKLNYFVKHAGSEKRCDLLDKKTLEEQYNKYNDRKYVHPDPLEFLYDYKDVRQREIVGLVAASLAYGQVKQILKSVSKVLKILGPIPAEFLLETSRKELENLFKDFKHRFTTGKELAGFLANTGHVIRKYGSLYECFESGYKKEKDLLPAILNFSTELRLGDCYCYNSLMPMPGGKCAYKRINLYLRWMVRKDNIDPGGWDGISTSKLIIPLDIHMHRVSMFHKLTERKQADMNAAIQITEALKKYAPDDPVKYDFALTRPGIYARNKPEETKDGV